MAGIFDSIGVLSDDPEFGVGGINNPTSRFAQERTTNLNNFYSDENQIKIEDATRQKLAIDNGLVRIGDSNLFTTPSMLLARTRSEKALAESQLDYEKFKEIRNSVGFRIADTLADTGRAFLSPLFWLSGQDTTRYDPSARLEASYRQAFNTNEKIREEVYLAAHNQRTTRARGLETAFLNRQTAALNSARYELAVNQFAFDQSQAGRTTETKNFDNYVRNMHGPDALKQAYTNPDIYKTFYNEYGIQSGSLIPISSSVANNNPLILPANIHNDARSIGDKWLTKHNKFLDEYSKVNKLYAALGDLDREAIERAIRQGKGIDISELNKINPNVAEQIATIFNFMKLLDPTSVVRESEYAVVANAGAIKDRIKQIGPRITEGDFIPPAILEDILSFSAELSVALEDSYKRERSSESFKLDKLGIVNDDNLFQDAYLGTNLFAESAQENIQHPMTDVIGDITVDGIARKVFSGEVEGENFNNGVPFYYDDNRQKVTVVAEN